MNTILTTERLQLREFTVTDAPFALELTNTDGWLTYIGDRNIKTQAAAEAYLTEKILPSYTTNGFGLWLVQLADTQTPIGMCGIVRRDTLAHCDIGFAFLPAFTGKGYALESATVTLAFAKNTLALPTILAITVEYNAHSIKLLERISLRYVETIRMSDDAEPLLLYRCDFH